MNLLTVKEYSALTGKNTNAIYTMKSMSKDKSIFKKVKGKLLIDATEAIKAIVQQEEFERLYYELIGNFKNESVFAKELGKEVSRNYHTVTMYFRDCFLKNNTHVFPSSVKQEYIDGMKRMAK